MRAQVHAGEPSGQVIASIARPEQNVTAVCVLRHVRVIMYTSALARQHVECHHVSVSMCVAE